MFDLEEKRILGFVLSFADSSEETSRTKRSRELCLGACWQLTMCCFWLIVPGTPVALSLIGNDTSGGDLFELLDETCSEVGEHESS